MATDAEAGSTKQFVNRLGEKAIRLFSRENLEEPVRDRAELVDGAEVNFIDRRAKTKPLEEHELVIVTADEYPAPGILRCRVQLEIPEGSALIRAGESSALRFGDKRVIVRPFSLAPPDRLEDLDRKHGELVPEALDGVELEPVEQAEDLLEAIVENVHADAE